MRKYLLCGILSVSLIQAAEAQTTQDSGLEGQVRRALNLIDPIGEIDPATYGARVVPLLQSILIDTAKYHEKERENALLMLSRVTDPFKLTAKPQVVTLLQSDRPRMRMYALMAFQGMAGPADTPVFIAMLNDPDRGVRLTSLESFLRPELKGNALALQLWYRQVREADFQRPEADRWLPRLAQTYAKVMKFQTGDPSSQGIN